MRVFKGTRMSGIAVSLVMTACTTSSTSIDNAIYESVTFDRVNTELLHNPLVNSESAWWESFGDSTLNSLVSSALSSSLELQQGEARLLQTGAATKAVRSGYWPSGSVSLRNLTSEYSKTEMPFLEDDARRNDIVSSSLNIGWDIDMFGQTRSLLRVSELRMIREEALLAAMRKNLAAETAHIWFELEGLRESLRINEAMQESWEESSRLSRVLLQEGRVAPIDVARVEVELMSVAAERPAILAAIKQRENLLAVLSGKPPSLFEVPEAGAITIHPVYFHIPNPENWVNQRPDLLAVEALARAAALDVDAVKSRFLPMLSIEGMLGYAAGSLSGLGSASSSTWFLSPVVSFPIFDRLRIAAELELKEAQQQEILLLWQDHVNKATAEVEYALENVIQGRNELQFYENRRDAASAVLQTGRVRYAAGSSDLIELLDLQRSLHSAEMALSQSHTRQRQALVKLHLALGSSLGNAES